MNSPTKKRGFRAIKVDDECYSWRFSGEVDIRFNNSPKQSALRVNFGWYDGWIHVNDEKRPPDFEPRVVTPKFVEQAIRFAVKNGWNRKRSVETKIFYRDRAFMMEMSAR